MNPLLGLAGDGLQFFPLVSFGSRFSNFLYNVLPRIFHTITDVKGPFINWECICTFSSSPSVSMWFEDGPRVLTSHRRNYIAGVILKCQSFRRLWTLLPNGFMWMNIITKERKKCFSSIWTGNWAWKWRKFALLQNI